MKIILTCHPDFFSFKQILSYSFCIHLFLSQSRKMFTLSQQWSNCCEWPWPNIALCLSLCSYSVPALMQSLLSWAALLHRGYTHSGLGEAAHPKTSHRTYQLHDWWWVAQTQAPNQSVQHTLLSPHVRYCDPTVLRLLHSWGDLEEHRNSIPKRWKAKGNSLQRSKMWYTPKITLFYLSVDFKSFISKTVKKTLRITPVSISMASCWFSFHKAQLNQYDYFKNNKPVQKGDCICLSALKFKNSCTDAISGWGWRQPCEWKIKMCNINQP